MKQKKIAFTGFWHTFEPESHFLTKLLREMYDVVITDLMSADYVIFSVASEDHWKANENCIKIFYTGEMVTPDFNACDFAIGFDWMEYSDRYYRLPLYYSDEKTCRLMERKHLTSVSDVLKGRKDFCSITVSNKKRDPFFITLYNKIDQYKRVDSGGRWNNNIGGSVDDKLAFDSTHKFSIVCENCAFPGYTTEKLAEAFAANCIPIYWGDPEITKVFNSQSFINVKDYSSLDEVLEQVRRIDCNDDIYGKMIQEPVYEDGSYLYDEQIRQFKNFLASIFDPPLEQVKKRNRVCAGKTYVQLRNILRTWAMPYFEYRAVRRLLVRIIRKCL